MKSKKILNIYLRDTIIHAFTSLNDRGAHWNDNGALLIGFFGLYSKMYLRIDNTIFRINRKWPDTTFEYHYE